MARRNDHTREELISMTLEQVKKFLSEHPHHELSLRKVAAMIGYVPSTLVNVFGNYNLLLLHAVAQTMDELFAEAEKQLQQSESTTDALRKLAYCYLNFAVDNPYRWQLIFQHTMNGEELPEWQNERINNMINMLESLIRQLIPDQSETAVMEASRVLWAGVHGITLLTVDDKLFTSTPVDGKALIDNLLDTYLNNWQV
ncbi:WHG domain-containing protein [Photobacterium sp. WH77]|uniref:TetR/AcrR family transcriptional regulator n=2 Tax=Photobacterium TaxID=657 RepID=A0A7X5B1K6_9GAMM|nr:MULTISPECIES: TetR-like C-terminal domain-containing protein [Photobacterium]MBD8512281.1 WHG domain-containing protein [Photobacterium arenosum]MBV7260642.1 WHG domain-containing protein [Photobacterium sp. WH24]MCG2835752.1 WHG domain-containing protein [Photobacterium sp. WH77]MCG2843571.1 WHG domain-containing protein [Photobacterium sp. WH80]MDO6579790.1 TetR-like C-terminal domain-containing protein [Photobacterium sp. 2_MG-2023]